MSELTNCERISGELYLEVVALLYDYVQCLDDGQLEEWPGLFTEDGIYSIVSRENVERNFPQPILHYTNAGMMRDRVLVLRQAAVFSLLYDRHVLSNPRVFRDPQGLFRVYSNFVVYKTDKVDGTTELFSVGKYEDVVAAVDSEFKFQSKIAIVDTYSVPNHMATPL